MKKNSGFNLMGFCKTLIASAFLAVSLSGCTWIKPLQGVEQVKVATTEEIINCQKVGSVNTTVLSKVGFIERSTDSVMEDSIALAKNEAIRMGGNRIVPQEKLKDGYMRFYIYLCKE